MFHQLLDLLAAGLDEVLAHRRFFVPIGVVKLFHHCAVVSSKARASFCPTRPSAWVRCVGTVRSCPTAVRAARRCVTGCDGSAPSARLLRSSHLPCPSDAHAVLRAAGGCPPAR